MPLGLDGGELCANVSFSGACANTRGTPVTRPEAARPIVMLRRVICIVSSCALLVFQRWQYWHRRNLLRGWRNRGVLAQKSFLFQLFPESGRDRMTDPLDVGPNLIGSVGARDHRDYGRMRQREL